MNSRDLARYIEENNGITKPWLLIQLRLKMLEERRSELLPHEYIEAIEELHGELMKLGEFWVGREDEVFNP
jgi:hypothetical protein